MWVNFSNNSNFEKLAYVWEKSIKLGTFFCQRVAEPFPNQIWVAPAPTSNAG